jgi:8-amino-7-oxononanoate synthase
MMKQLPDKLAKRLEQRLQNNALRKLSVYDPTFDFSSNDYLGLAAAELNSSNKSQKFQGAGGSRLLTGNHKAYEVLETQICSFHESQAALVFNSGYAANLGLLGAIGQRGDHIFYDALAHASIRDGLQLSNAKSLKYRHNDLIHLEQLLENHKESTGALYVVTESVFSMDGDSPDLEALVNLCERYGAYLIVDEAHALGVIGARGHGLVQALQMQDRIFARIVTFGKALGYHGAAVLGSETLKTYLVNFARSLIYTTALAEDMVYCLADRYTWLSNSTEALQELEKLHRNIALLRSYTEKYGVSKHFIASDSAIHSVIIPGNDRVKTLSDGLNEAGFGVLPILAPTVPEGAERLRICLHSFNESDSIEGLVERIASFLKD